jgi:DNA-binding beta-propeller fold protein YncE
MLQAILDPAHDWVELPVSLPIKSDLYPSTEGQVVFASGNQVYQLNSDGQYQVVSTLKSGERLVGDALTMRASALYKNGQKVADGLRDCQAVQELADGKYVALCHSSVKSTSRVNVLSAGVRALAVAPDYRFCVTGQAGTHHLHSTIMDKQGTMLYSEPFYYLHDLSNGTLATAGNMTFDVAGNLYVATPMGVQVADHNGRVRAILSLPAGQVHSLAFSSQYLYVRCADKIFVRLMKTKGHNPQQGAMSYKSQGQG